jgi:hypothetical protein
LGVQRIGSSFLYRATSWLETPAYWTSVCHILATATAEFGMGISITRSFMLTLGRISVFRHSVLIYCCHVHSGYRFEAWFLGFILVLEFGNHRDLAANAIINTGIHHGKLYLPCVGLSCNPSSRRAVAIKATMIASPTLVSR